MKTVYQREDVVRDYELDSQGIVNNATYINYFEHCRNTYGRAVGIDVAAYFAMGYTLVVAEIQIQYRYPLTVNEDYIVTAEMTHFDQRRMYFSQELLRKTDQKSLAIATVQIACIDQKTGRSGLPEVLQQQLTAILQQVGK
jgi:acyl-CoA thioester hydrolase